MTTLRITALVACVVAGSLLSACTAGVVVDKDFNPVSTSAFGTLTFVAVDDAGKPTGDQYTYFFVGGSARGYAVSFDPYAADTDRANAQWVNGVPNATTFIPEGNYYVAYAREVVAPVPDGAASQIFAHRYAPGCNDFFSGGTERCAQYYFQILDDQPSCRGSGCFGPPLVPHNGVPVIPLYADRKTF